MLTAPPSLGTVVVKVNGQRLLDLTPQGDRVWTLDTATRTLTFTPACVPAPGAKLGVE